jgi:hypothetical protein
MIQWLASTIDGNEERGKMVMDPMKAASHGEESRNVAAQKIFA